MPIKAPAWAKGAHPTTRGWVKNGELLRSQKISQADIDAWYGREVVVSTPQPESNPVVEPEPIVVEENIEITEDDLENMTKKEIDDLALDHGIELDRREKKETMINKFMGFLSNR